MLDLWFVTSYVTRTTAAHFLHDSVSKAAFILTLPLESVRVHNHGYQQVVCPSWQINEQMASLKSAVKDKQLVVSRLFQQKLIKLHDLAKEK